MRFSVLFPLPMFRPGLLAAVLFIVVSSLGLRAGPFDQVIQFTQPGGRVIELHGRGDEFYAVFETLDGFTVVFDEARLAYCYAKAAADGTLVSSGLEVGVEDPAASGLAKGLRMSGDARKRQVIARWQRWEAGMQLEQAWAERKAALRQFESDGGADGSGNVKLAPPGFTTTGVKVGLTLLVDFSDAVATIPQAEIVNFCNGDNYTGYGNSGSVKQYYRDNSNGLLTYSNIVTVYIRAPKPKSYYNVTTNDSGAQANLLIKDVLDTMKALPNYATEIMPTFANLTVDGSSRVVACNVFYAGGNGGVWSKGLWPHSWSLYNVGAQSLNNGKSVYKYQITDISSDLAIGTFCHENGHMLCGYPDIYDYDYDSSGGAGAFCLMNSGGSGGNPVQICAYLKRASGWATTINVSAASSLLANLGTTGTNFNKFYRFQKPGVATEYYLLENRQKSGRDANIPGGGVLIWHVDELGNHNNQSTNYNTTHANYEASLIQADNQFHLQRDVNNGDSRDPFYLGNGSAGYRNEFSPTSAPAARWWDGTASGATFTGFSASGSTMTFRIGAPEPPLTVVHTLLADANGNGVVDFNETNQYWIVLRNDGALTASNVTATLTTTTPEVSILADSATYPNAAPGALTTNATPFVFATSASFPCGTPIQFTALASVPGRTTTNAFAQATGATPPPTRADNNTAQFIADLATIYSTNVITGFTGTVGAVTVSLYLTHAYDGNLVIDLLAPDGTANNLVSRRGSSGDHFGTNCLADATRTTFDSAATVSITSGAAPFVGTYRPEGTFAVHSGKSGAAVNGPWRLRVRDAASSNTGTLQCWSLQLTQTATCLDGSLQPPVVLLESPLNRQLFAVGEPITLRATVTDPDSPVEAVEFFADGALLTTLAAPPYEFVWTNAPAGSHSILIRAVDATALTTSTNLLVGVDAGLPMQWSGGVSPLWSEGFNWTRFRAPTNGEPLLFADATRPHSTNDLLTTAGPVTLAGSGFVLAGNWLTLTGGIASAGVNQITMASRLGASQTFASSSGLLTISGNITNQSYSLTLDGAGDLALAGWISGSGNLQKRGEGTATLSHTNTYTGGTVVHAGTLALTRGGLLGSLRGALTINSGGMVRSEVADALGYGTIRANPILISGGTFFHAAAANLSLWGTTVSLTGGTLAASNTGGCSLDLGTDASIGNTATIINAASSTNTSWIAGGQVRLRQSNTILNVNDGTAHPDLCITAPITSVTSNSGITKVGLGTLALGGTNTFTGLASVGAGTLLLRGELGTNLLVVGSTATLGGNGLVRGRVTVNAGGTLAPGEGIGRLAATNTVQLSGIAWFEISRAGAALTNDVLAGVSVLTLGGTLRVTNLGDELAVGDSFRLFEAAAYQGNFTSYDLPPLADGKLWDLGALQTEGIIRVAAPPTVTSQPQSQTALAGDPANFAVEASGSAPLAYQWRKDGTALAGATETALQLAAVSLADAGVYDVLVTNLFGSVTSSPATLVVAPRHPPIAFNFTGGVLTLSWPDAVPGFRLQSQTNAPGAGLGPDWFDVPGVQTNSFVVPLDATQGGVFYRLLRP
jgi:M6 family metalloprotease-like protein